MAWVCNTCADKDPDVYPPDCKLVITRPGDPLLECEQCGNKVAVLNKPQLHDDLVDDWEDIRMSVDSRSRLK